MENIRLFFQRNRKYGLGIVDFDILLNETHNFNATVTEHPIEIGSTISDHIDNDLENGTITGMVTNFSITTSGITSNRAQDFFDTLVSLWEERTTFSIRSILRIYDDVAITAMPISKNASDGESLEVSISFKKINRVNLKTSISTTSIVIQDIENTEEEQVVAEEADAGFVVPMNVATPAFSNLGGGGFTQITQI